MEKIFTGKNIILGVTGSIAAYKSPLLVRELKKLGANVHVILTPSAVNFVTPLTLSNLSKNPVWIEMFDESAQRGGAWHIQTAHECSAMIIAPASATTIGKLANGICDNALIAIATALPKNIPLLIAPAMDFTMLEHPSTQENLNKLKNWGAIIIPPDEGELSSGLVGRGRLPNTEVLIDYIYKSLNSDSFNNNIYSNSYTNNSNLDNKVSFALNNNLYPLDYEVDKTKWQAELELEKLKNTINNKNNILKGKKVLITAGPTIEMIDDVRFISNFSSGKMGYFLAETCRDLGMDVTLISGKVNLKPIDGIKTIYTYSANDMYQETMKYSNDYDIAILSAAVSDFTPIIKYDGKIKKENINDSLNLELKRTKDILFELGKIKKSNQILVGFALESSNEIENGWKKLKNKNANIIIANSSKKEKSGFEGDLNTIVILNDKGLREDFEPMHKKDCSIYIMKSISNYIQKNDN